jgi:hypothetical protein
MNLHKKDIKTQIITMKTPLKLRYIISEQRLYLYNMIQI